MRRQTVAEQGHWENPRARADKSIHSQSLAENADGHSPGNVPVTGQGGPRGRAGLITGLRRQHLCATWLPLCQGGQQPHEVWAEGVGLHNEARNLDGAQYLQGKGCCVSDADTA